MKSFRLIVVTALLSGSDAFQFMSNWKITPPANVEMQEKVKEKFGDKSECKVYDFKFSKYFTNVCFIELMTTLFNSYRIGCVNRSIIGTWKENSSRYVKKSSIFIYS